MRKPRPNQIFVEGKVVYERRFLMEKLLGRKLARHEQVYNINGDTKDNRPENLAIRVIETDKLSVANKHYKTNLLGRWKSKLAKDSGVDKSFITDEMATLYSLTSRVHGVLRGPSR